METILWTCFQFVMRSHRSHQNKWLPCREKKASKRPRIKWLKILHKWLACYLVEANDNKKSEELVCRIIMSTSNTVLLLWFWLSKHHTQSYLHSTFSLSVPPIVLYTSCNLYCRGCGGVDSSAKYLNMASSVFWSI